MSYVRIVQPERDSSGATNSMGTKILLDDGSELQGVYKIVLTAQVNDVWRAELHVMPNMTDMSALATIHRPNLWERLKYWAKGKL